VRVHPASGGRRGRRRGPAIRLRERLGRTDDEEVPVATMVAVLVALVIIVAAWIAIGLAVYYLAQ
jgi:hypothetical protein